MSGPDHEIIDNSGRLARLFLHYFDIHFIEEKGRASESRQFYNEMRLATRLAVASADKVFVPAASYFESPLCREILSQLQELVDLGFVVLSASSRNLDDFRAERLRHKFLSEEQCSAPCLSSPGRTLIEPSVPTQNEECNT